MRHLVFAGVMVAALGVSSAFAALNRPMTGMWKGRVHFDLNDLPVVKNVKQNSARLRYLQSVEQATLTLTLKADHTYSLIAVVPSRGTQRVAGKWSMSGNALSMEQYSNGRYSGDPQTFTVDKLGKSLTLKKVDANGLHSTLTYSR